MLANIELVKERKK